MTAPNQQPTNNRYPETFMQGVILGLLLGAVLVLWFSPQTGRELLAVVRKRLPISASITADRRRE